MDKITILEFPEKTLLTRRETASVLNVSLANFDASISKKLERIEIGRRVLSLPVLNFLKMPARNFRF